MMNKVKVEGQVKQMQMFGYEGQIFVVAMEAVKVEKKETTRS